MKCLTTTIIILIGTATANALPACNDTGVTDLLLRIMYQEPLAAYRSNLQSSHPQGAPDETENWSADIENFRQLGEKPNGTKICAATIIYSDESEPTKIAGNLLLHGAFSGNVKEHALSRRVCLGEFRFTIEGLLDKPDQYYVNYACADD